MLRAILIFEGQRVALPLGETLLGRAIDCRIRFNDLEVSRHHLRFIARAEGVTVENLSSTNGSTMNGGPLRAAHRLAHGDRLVVGYRHVAVELADADSISRREQALGDRPISVTATREAAPGLLVEDEVSPAEDTRPGTVSPRELLSSSSSFVDDTGVGDERNCHRCGARVDGFEDRCGDCGAERPDWLPSSQTQKIVLDEFHRRRAPRSPIVVPVIYSSELLTLDAVARDVSVGGMFVATEILDPVGTECRVTALPDGYAALDFRGVVRHVSPGGRRLRPTGLGIQFEHKSEAAARWLDAVLGSPGDTETE